MNVRDIELICNFLMFNFKYYPKKEKKNYVYAVLLSIAILIKGK